jgi:pyruvate dehydrogenase E1 component alpha subunit
MAAKGAAYNMPATTVDGMNLMKVYETVKQAVDHVRAGNGPYFIEALCYRFPGHSMGDPERYRAKEEVDQQRQRDPIITFGKQLEQANILDEGELEHIDQAVAQEIESIAAFADGSPAPTPESLYAHIYSTPTNGR